MRDNGLPNSAVTDSSQIAVYQAVRCVGTLKPIFDPDSNAFKAPELNVSGTGFWVKEYECFVTCAHVIEDLLGVSIDLAGMLVVGGNGCPYQRMRFSIVDMQHDLAILCPDDSSDDLKKQITRMARTEGSTRPG